MDKKVRDIMTPNPVGVYYDQTIGEAAQMMRDADVGVILVVREGSLGGVVTDRDLVIRGLAEGAGPESPVGPLCSAKLVGVDADSELADAGPVTFHPPVTGRGHACPMKRKQISSDCRTRC